MQIEDRQKHLKILSEETGICMKCELHQERKIPVFSRGNINALVAISGINPGQEERETGIPFVGRSGKLLDRTIQELGLDPSNDVYIFNAVKCPSPNNRAPTSSEIQSCYPYLQRHIEMIPAKVIITLGTLATHILTDQAKPITQLRGQMFPYKDRFVIHLFHPSYLIRSGNENSIHYPTFKSDLQLAFNKAKELQ